MSFTEVSKRIPRSVLDGFYIAMVELNEHAIKGKGEFGTDVCWGLCFNGAIGRVIHIGYKEENTEYSVLLTLDSES